jgi:hypothetical protein
MSKAVSFLTRTQSYTGSLDTLANDPTPIVYTALLPYKNRAIDVDEEVLGSGDKSSLQFQKSKDFLSKIKESKGNDLRALLKSAIVSKRVSPFYIAIANRVIHNRRQNNDLV